MAPRADTDNRHGWTHVTCEEELRRVVGQPAPRVGAKVRRSLHEHDRAWLRSSPFCLVATSAADGSCDVSPKGDPPGFVTVLDDTTIVIPERPGNRRADSFLNLFSNPQVGVLSLVPGRGDTLRINGHGRLLRDAPFFDELVVAGHRPRLALVVEVEEVFYHCSKAFLRSQLWEPDTWHPDALPSRAQIAKSIERPEDPLHELERYYGPDYAEGLY